MSENSLTEKRERLPRDARPLTAAPSLGLMFAWMLSGWNYGGITFGMRLESLASYPLLVQTAIGLSFACLALDGRPPERLAPRRRAAVGSLLAVASVALLWLGSAHGIAALEVASALAAGASFAVFMHAWLCACRLEFPDLLIAFTLISGIQFLLHPSVYAAFLGEASVHALPLTLPLLAAAAFMAMPVGASGDAAGARRAEASRQAQPHQSASLVLCYFASSVASLNIISGSGSKAYAITLISFGCAVALMLARPPHREVPFSALSIFTCVCVALVLALPSKPSWLMNATSIGYWLLFCYALVFFSQPSGRRGLPRLGGLAVLYLSCSAASLVRPVIPEQVSSAIALVLTACAFALAFVGATNRPQGEPPETRGKSGTGDVRRGGRKGADGIIEPYGLTRSEGEVFLYLSKGYSLKQIAAELHVSESTAKFHRHDVYQKLGISSRQELISMVNAGEDAPS